jgi:hypothetical protein
MKISKNEQKDMLYYGAHIVAFVDILGQSRVVDSFKDTEWWQMNDLTKDLLNKSYGRVSRFRKIFTDYLKSFCKPAVLDNVFKKLVDPEDSSAWDHFGEKRILIKTLSDSLILTCPLQIENGHIPLKSIFGILTACAIGSLNALNYDFAIRGAVELGPCIFDPKSKEVYGTALNDAVKYEKMADWPRIVVGPMLVKYLTDCSELKSDQMMQKINSGLASTCLSAISKDDAGTYYLDIFKSAFDDINKSPETNKIIEGAIKFTEEQLVIYQNDEKIRQKYENLMAYLKGNSVS